MTITTTLAADFEDELLAAWRARPGLADVQVLMGPPGDELRAGDFLVTSVGDDDDTIRADEKYGVLGNIRRRELITIDCLIMVHKPGGGEDVIKAARDRAHEIFAEVAEEFRTAANPANNHALTLSDKAHSFEISSWTERRGATSSARWSQIPFLITYKGNLPSS